MTISPQPTPAQAAESLIATYYGTFNRGDRQAFLARMVQCHQEQIQDIRITVAADGTHAAAESVVHGTNLSQDDCLPPATGQTYRLPGGAFFDLRAAKEFVGVR